MRNIMNLMQNKLDTGSTTLCTCHIITRKDGLIQGFTDHDLDLVIEGVICHASTGFSASEMSERLGFSISGGEIAGGLIADSLSENDIMKGLYDGAKVAIWLVDWQEPALRLLLRQGTIGEIVREGSSFRAEIRSRLAELDIEKGRAYLPTCSALVGDAACKININSSANKVMGMATSVSSNYSFSTSGLTAFAAHWFSQGKLIWLTGQNQGLTCEVHSFISGAVVLRQEMPMPINTGDSFAIYVGCDKRFSTCKTKFNNVLNFHGFPHIPGNDFLSSYPVPGEGENNGGILSVFSNS